MRRRKTSREQGYYGPGDVDLSKGALVLGAFLVICLGIIVGAWLGGF